MDNDGDLDPATPLASPSSEMDNPLGSDDRENKPSPTGLRGTAREGKPAKEKHHVRFGQGTNPGQGEPDEDDTKTSKAAESQSEDIGESLLHRLSEYNITASSANSRWKGLDQKAAQSARDRAEKLSRSLDDRKVKSAPASRSTSPKRSPPASPTWAGPAPPLPKDMTNLIPMKEVERGRKRFERDLEADTEPKEKPGLGEKTVGRFTAAAKRLVDSHRHNDPKKLRRVKRFDGGLASGQATPVADRGDPEHYIPKPKEYRGGVLGALLKMYNEDGMGSALDNSYPAARHYRSSLSGQSTPNNSPPSPSSSGHTTPKRKIPKWHEKSPMGDLSGSISLLVNSSTVLARPAAADQTPPIRPSPLERHGSSGIETLRSLGRRRHRTSVDHSIHIQYHIEEILARQRYIFDMCRSLMRYGAPTHRLEEYMRMSARVLEIDGQFLYMPGTMIISFDDPTTHTTEVKIVREAQSVDLGRLIDIHEIYKAVMHDKIGVKESSEALDELWNQKDRYGPWTRVLLHGLASATVAPFAFDGRPIDMPIAFLLGTILGFMQLIVAPRSELYSNIFEITATVVTSFLARMFGSLRGGELFCFSALAQSSIALILPGYTVLSGALELQAKSLVAGSVRMVYAIIYSLFLGFGITIGTAFYGGIDANATAATTCSANPLSTHAKFAFVPAFTLCLALINQAKPQQLPAMLLIAFAGYVVNFFSATRFASNAQIANTLGALAIGVLGNAYSRFLKGMSAAALMPAIFVQVPSGLAASGSLISGITSADQIVKNSNGSVTTVSNGTQAGSIHVDVNSAVLNVGYSMIQVAIGLTVGLFFSSLLVYPLGKKRSGLFSF